jgi:hypothetical protein
MGEKERMSIDARARARDDIASDFAVALAADFKAHGAAAIARLRDKELATYLRLVAAIEPAALNHGTSPFADLSDDELVRARELVDQLLELGVAR